MVVLEVANMLDVDLIPNDIEISHKLKCRGATNTIIAKFVIQKAKIKLYKQHTKLKDIQWADLYPSFASAINTDRIFLNKNLTNFRHYLFGKSKKVEDCE